MCTKEPIGCSMQKRYGEKSFVISVNSNYTEWLLSHYGWSDQEVDMDIDYKRTVYCDVVHDSE